MYIFDPGNILTKVHNGTISHAEVSTGTLVGLIWIASQ